MTYIYNTVDIFIFDFYSLSELATPEYTKHYFVF